MARSADLATLFLHPASTAQRHYEICRAYFLEQHTAEVVAERFQLSVASIRSLVRDFAQHPNLDQLFGRAPPADRSAPKRDAIRDRACAVRHSGRRTVSVRAATARPGAAQRRASGRLARFGVRATAASLSGLAAAEVAGSPSHQPHQRSVYR